ncbi:MmyB family transcriptional regulator [Micromonospora sp. BQ11]|uniref:MmyB family transcriptional regulator n=1 Tax=Micromonospora sp. BQ11 TaxID=3452212 RepID=UPI003F8CBAD6
MAQVCEGLLARSARFREIWRDNEARGKQLEVKTFHHPEVGPLTLRMQAFDVRAAAGPATRRLPRRTRIGECPGAAAAGQPGGQPYRYRRPPYAS